MRRRLAASIVLCVALLWAQAAQAALAAVSLGSHAVGSSTANPITTAGNACPVGSTIVLMADHNVVASTLASVADSAGNTWQTPLDEVSTTSQAIAFAYAKGTTVNLPIGGTITATFSGATPSGVAAICISGASGSSPLDTHAHTQVGLAATSATSVSTGVLAQATELVVGLVGQNAASGVVTCGGSFTQTVTNSAANGSTTICTQAVAATTSVAFAPTWVNSAAYGSDVISFQAPFGGHSLTTMGVGN